MDKRNNLDLAIMAKELKLLLKILSVENDESSDALYNELFKDIEWKVFLQLAWHHRVYPLIYSKLKKMDSRMIPTHVIENLQREFKKNTFKMLHLSGETEQISKLFTENNILLLFLKGPVIAADIYGDISLRTSKDLDILIPINDLKKAEKLLLTNGYEREEIPGTVNEWKKRRQHLSYFHPQKKIEIEIHWRLHPPPSKEPSFDELWERKRISLHTSYPVYFLAKEDLFLFLVAHGARHGWFRLRWLIDIDRLVRKKISMEQINLFSNKYQMNHMIGQALILSSQLLNTPINKDMQLLTEGVHSRKIAQKAIPFIYEMNRYQYQKDYLFSLKSNSEKIYFMRILFFPSSEDSKTFKLPKLLHILYFPLRLFLWIRRKTKKSKFL